MKIFYEICSKTDKNSPVSLNLNAAIFGFILKKEPNILSLVCVFSKFIFWVFIVVWSMIVKEVLSVFMITVY